MNLLARVQENVRRRGAVGTARHAAAQLSPRAGVQADVDWFAMDLRDLERPRRHLDPAFTLRRGDLADMALLDQIPSDREVVSLSPALVDLRLGGGAELWLVVEGDRLAFRCWIFRGWAPLQRVPGQRMALPPDVVVLEDSIASPHVRGRGVAPGAWSAIGDRLAEEPALATMVTKVSVGNTATRRALAKVGFRDIAGMRISGPAWRTRIEATEREGNLPWLRALAR